MPRRPLREFPPSQPRAPVQSVSLVRKQESERKRITRDLHDEIGQGLMSLRLSLGMLLGEAPDGPVKARAQEALEILDNTIEGLRRIIRRFSPKALEDMGLLGAIRREAKLLSDQTGMQQHLRLPKRWSPVRRDVEIAIYRLVQEALHNVSKHSGAANFGVSLGNSGKRIQVRISDDGVGFTAKTDAPLETFGLDGMRERAEEAGGSLKIDSAKNGGTRIEIEIPVEPGHPPAIQPSAENATAKAS
ncbi:MAG: sensor histidine kinase [Terriglobales bacterium]